MKRGELQLMLTITTCEILELTLIPIPAAIRARNLDILLGQMFHFINYQTFTLKTWSNCLSTVQKSRVVLRTY